MHLESNPRNPSPEPVLFHHAMLNWPENRATGKTVVLITWQRLEIQRKEPCCKLLFCEKFHEGRTMNCRPRSKCRMGIDICLGDHGCSDWSDGFLWWVMVNQACFPSPFILVNFSAFFKTQDILSPLRSFPSVRQTELVPFGLLKLFIHLSLLDDVNHHSLLFLL